MEKKPPLEYRLRSQKHIMLARQVRGKIANNTFDEYDIRLGLTLIRETVYAAVAQIGRPDTPQSLRQALPILVDICDAVAHPSVKDRGAIFNYVKRNDEAIKVAKSKMHTQRFVHVANSVDGIPVLESLMPPAIKELSISAVPGAYLFFLDTFTGDETASELFIKVQNDIALCLFSILQYCQIPLWSKEEEALPIKDRRLAYLGINSFHGYYHLYAAVANSLQFSEAERLAMRKDESPKYAHFVVCSWIAPLGDGIPVDIKELTIVAAVRCDDGKLRLREI